MSHPLPLIRRARPAAAMAAAALGLVAALTACTPVQHDHARRSITPGDFSIVDEPGAAAYPISGYSWVLVSARQPSQSVGKALVGLLSWLTGPGQSYAASLGYVPLPPAIRGLAATTLTQVTGPGRAAAG